MGPDGLGTPSPKAVPGVTVGAILGGVQVVVGELGDDVVVERAVDGVEAVPLVGRRDLVVHLAHAGERQPVIGQKLGCGDAVSLEVKLALQLPKKEAEGVSYLAVGITHVGEDLVIAGNVA